MYNYTLFLWAKYFTMKIILSNTLEIDTDINRLDKEVIYSFLKTTYWA